MKTPDARVDARTGAGFAAAVLAVVALLAYAFWIPWLGAYWDDWYMIWAMETGGSVRLMEGLAADRPLHGLLYTAATALHGVTPVGLHLLVLATRWASALAAWWTIRAIWPDRQVEALATALLFLVYPGFSQQSVAVTYSDFYLTLAFFLLSLGGMLWALRSPRHFWGLFALSLLAAIPAHWVLEYWFGLELLRLPLAAWVIDARFGLRDRLKRAVAVTAPYWANIVVAVLWHLMVTDTTARDDRRLSGYLASMARDPVGEMAHRVGLGLSDLASSIVFAWARALQPGLPEMRIRFVVAAVLLVAAAGAVTGLALRRVDRTHRRATTPGTTPARSRMAWGYGAMVVGLAAIIVGQLPMWITDRNIQWERSLDRHSLSAMLGATLFMTGFLHALIRRRAPFILATALLVGFGASFQFRMGHEYAREHGRQADFFWQLHWRAPGLEPGTMVFLHHEPLAWPEPKDYTYGVPLALIYGPAHEAGDVPLWVFPDAPGFQPHWLALVGTEAAEGAAVVRREIRNLGVTGSTGRAVVAVHRPPGCLRVLDPERDELVDVPGVVRAARLRSQPALIRPDGEHRVGTLRRLYGSEPERGWCHHFQRAELALQRGDWVAVGELADQVLERSLTPADDREWAPFIEGYVRAGRREDAGRLIDAVVPYRGTIWSLHERYARNHAFCDLLARLRMDTGPAGAGAILDIDPDPLLECPAVPG